MNTEAIGATVEIATSEGTQSRPVMPTKSYLSQMELPVTFGLGEGETVESVTITWPDGGVTELGGLDANREHTIVREPDAG